MTPRREMAVAVALVVLGAVVALLVGGRPAGSAAAQPSDDGRAVSSALGLVCLAGAGALLFLGRWARLAVAVLLCAAGVGVVVSAFSGGSVWTWLAAAGGVAIVAGGLLTLLRCARWPVPRAGSEASRPSAGEPDRPGARDTWEALDRGEDPTT